MSVSESIQQKLDDNFILPFKVGDHAIRGRIIRMGSQIDQILSRHPYNNAVKETLGEVAALTAMMGSSLKFDGRFILQLQGDGPASILVSDYTTKGGQLRAMASVSDEISDEKTLQELLGDKAHIAVTIDQGPDMERYRGVTPLEGETLSSSAVAYFDQSEQIPTAVKLAVGRVSAPGIADQWRAGGIMVQFMPGEGGARERGDAILKAPEDRDAWERAEVFLQTTQSDELLDPAISAEMLLYRLYHEDGVRVFEPSAISAECSCNSGKISAVLKRYSKDELAEMVEDGFIRVTCEFCRTEYLFSEDGAPVSG